MQENEEIKGTGIQELKTEATQETAKPKTVFFLKKEQVKAIWNNTKMLEELQFNLLETGQFCIRELDNSKIGMQGMTFNPEGLQQINGGIKKFKFYRAFLKDMQEILQGDIIKLEVIDNGAKINAFGNKGKISMDGLEAGEIMKEPKVDFSGSGVATFIISEEEAGLIKKIGALGSIFRFEIGLDGVGRVKTQSSDGSGSSKTGSAEIELSVCSGDPGIVANYPAEYVLDFIGAGTLRFKRDSPLLFERQEEGLSCKAFLAARSSDD